MAQFIRAKQAGVHRDLSAGLSRSNLSLVEHSRFGVNSRILDIAYDPVQALLTVGTSHSSSAPGRVYIFGRSRVQASFPASSNTASVQHVAFCRDKVVALDSAGVLIVYSLSARRVIKTHRDTSAVTAIMTDPALEFVFLGHQTGHVSFYDLTVLMPVPTAIKHLGLEFKGRVVSSAVKSIQLHPRDLGTMLVTFAEGVVLYSFTANAPLGTLTYDIAETLSGRPPKMVTATWHPTGTFVVGGYDNGHIVFWDSKTKKRVAVQKAGAGGVGAGGPQATFCPKQIAWCAKADPDDTALLIYGGDPPLGSVKGLAFSQLGRTPIYATSSWDTLSSHLLSPVRTKLIPTPPNLEIVKFCLVPRRSPFFAGAQEPIAVIILLSSGELITTSFPSGYPVPPANQIPISLSFVHPFICKIEVSPVDDQIWARIVEDRKTGPKLLRGGAEAKGRASETRMHNILHASHADGFVRLWDASHYSAITNRSVVQVDVNLGVGRVDNVHVTGTSFSALCREMSVGLHSGEILIFRWDVREAHVTKEAADSTDNPPRTLIDISSRMDRDLEQGFLPLVLYNAMHGPVTALQHTDIGFVAAGFEDGSIVVIDLRGPRVLPHFGIPDHSQSKKRASMMLRTGRSGGSSASPEATPTSSDPISVLQFSVMTCEEDSYSSILLHAGTKAGVVGTFKIIPSGASGYQAVFAGAVSCDGPIVQISGIDLTTGGRAAASPAVVAGLSKSQKVNGALVVTSRFGVRIFKPATSKGAHKTWGDEFSCVSAEVVSTPVSAPQGERAEVPAQMMVSALAVLGDDGIVRLYSIPGLKELASVSVVGKLDLGRLGGSTILPSGEIYGWSGPSEVVALDLFGNEALYPEPSHYLFNESFGVPERPVISNMQWISGTQHVTPESFATLLRGSKVSTPGPSTAGPGPRPRQARPGAAATAGAAGAAEAGYFAALQNAVSDRAANLNGLEDTMEQLGTQVAGFTAEVQKMVDQQKKKAVLGFFGL